MKNFILLLIMLVLFSCEKEEDFNPNEKTTTIELGVWNMKNISSKCVSFNSNNIVDIDCFILADTSIMIPVKLNSWERGNNDFKGTIEFIDNQIIIKRTSNGFFDSEFYDSKLINRGYVIIKYY